MSWRQAGVIAVVLGTVLSVGMYLYLSAVGNMIAREDRQLDYEFLRMSNALVWADDSGCGLSNSEACNALDYAQTQVLPTNELKVIVEPVNASNVPYCDAMWYDDGIKCEIKLDVQVPSGYQLQPFGIGAEDDVRAMDAAQPTYHPTVTMHGLFLQDATAKLQ